MYLSSKALSKNLPRHQNYIGKMETEMGKTVNFSRGYILYFNNIIIGTSITTWPLSTFQSLIFIIMTGHVTQN